MKLAPEEEAILGGRWGEPARRALEMQIATGEFFGAQRMVPVTSAHLTGDPESMGDAGLAFVEDLVRQGGRFVVPTTTNSCNVDFALYRELGQPEEVAQKERRLRELIKQLGATLASYGSLAMFHVVGMTPEARALEEAFGGKKPLERIVVEVGDLGRTYRSFVPEKDKVDLVVFGTPHLSIFEVRTLACLLEGRKVSASTMLLLTTNSPVKALSDQEGYTKAIEAAGGRIVVGVCYYIMTPREMARRHGLRTIVTDSAKLANIIAAYGYNPIFRPTAECVEAAISGRIAR